MRAGFEWPGAAPLLWEHLVQSIISNEGDTATSDSPGDRWSLSACQPRGRESGGHETAAARNARVSRRREWVSWIGICATGRGGRSIRRQRSTSGETGDCWRPTSPCNMR